MTAIITGYAAIAACATAVFMATILLRALWGRPEEGDAVWGSALPTDLPSAEIAPEPAPAPVEHIEVSETPAPVGAIGTVADHTSDDLAWMLTARERSIANVWDQAHADHDLWCMGAAIDQAFADYETRLLTSRRWGLWSATSNAGVESTQQRIDRWLREGGDGISAHRADARRAASETWDAPSGQLPLIERPDAQGVAEAMLSA